MLDEVKESIMNAYEIKTGLNRTKISHLMDAESWFNAKKAVELGFADEILFDKSEMWTQNQRSLLIHSILANFPIPNIYVLREDSEEVDEKGKAIYNFSVLDGKQKYYSLGSYTIATDMDLVNEIKDILRPIKLADGTDVSKISQILQKNANGIVSMYIGCLNTLSGIENSGKIEVFV